MRSTLRRWDPLRVELLGRCHRLWLAAGRFPLLAVFEPAASLEGFARRSPKYPLGSARRFERTEDASAEGNRPHRRVLAGFSYLGQHPPKAIAFRAPRDGWRFRSGRVRPDRNLQRFLGIRGVRAADRGATRRKPFRLWRRIAFGKDASDGCARKDRSPLAPVLELPSRAIPRRRQRQRLQGHARSADPRDRVRREHAGPLLEPRRRMLSDSISPLLADRRLLRRPLPEAPRAVLDQVSGDHGHGAGNVRLRFGERSAAFRGALPDGDAQRLFQPRKVRHLSGGLREQGPLVRQRHPRARHQPGDPQRIDRRRVRVQPLQGTPGLRRAHLCRRRPGRYDGGRVRAPRPGGQSECPIRLDARCLRRERLARNAQEPRSRLHASRHRLLRVSRLAVSHLDSGLRPQRPRARRGGRRHPPRRAFDRHRRGLADRWPSVARPRRDRARSARQPRHIALRVRPRTLRQRLVAAAVRHPGPRRARSRAPRPVVRPVHRAAQLAPPAAEPRGDEGPAHRLLERAHVHRGSLRRRAALAAHEPRGVHHRAGHPLDGVPHGAADRST